MPWTIYNSRSDSSQSFRHASLSSGLDIIIRKALGGQQIAIAQTTDIDRANGTVNLTTLLLHTGRRTPNWSRKLPPGLPCKVKRRKPWKNQHLPRLMQVRPNHR
jgi:hypothetical protein